MIDREVLRQRRVKAGINAGLADMGGEIGRRGDFVDRHFPRLVVRAGKRLVDADRENRQVVEKERVEMIGVEHDDDVGTDGGQVLLLRGKQLGGFAIRPVALDEERKHRGVRHAEPGDDAGHFISSCQSIRFHAAPVRD